jgi:ATP-dependent Clp protease ATP-binding subunit ClpC
MRSSLPAEISGAPQAATRHNGGVFERFTDRARRVVVSAQEEAVLLDHDFIGTEHILLGLLRDTDMAGQMLQGLGFDLDASRARIGAGASPGPRSAYGQTPFTPAAKKALEMSLREALQLGDRFIGTEHLLLGLLREGQGLATRLLNERGLQLDGVRRAVAAVDGEIRRHGAEPSPDPPEVGDGGDAPVA